MSLCSTDEDTVPPAHSRTPLLQGLEAARARSGARREPPVGLGLHQAPDLFSNSLFSEKRKAALMEAFKIQELWVPLLCQAKVDSLKLFYIKKCIYLGSFQKLDFSLLEAKLGT